LKAFSIICSNEVIVTLADLGEIQEQANGAHSTWAIFRDSSFEVTGCQW